MECQCFVDVAQLKAPSGRFWKWDVSSGTRCVFVGVIFSFSPGSTLGCTLPETNIAPESRPPQ